MSKQTADSDNRICGPDESARDIILVPTSSREWLNQRQYVDYHSHREKLCQWMLNVGKDPSHAAGYAFSTARNRATYLDTFYRYVWDERSSYTTQIDTDDCDDYCRHLAYQDYSKAHKHNVQKALKMWVRFAECGDWTPEITFNGETSRTQPRDFFTKEERVALREGSLEYGTVPSYENLSKDERHEWERHIAQRFRVPIEDVGKHHFDRANGFKIPSLVWTSLDAALRPIEVGKARIQWVDFENNVLRIPIEDSAKNRDHWKVALQERTTAMLERWIDERQLYDRYNDSEHIWLTREGQPYSSRSLGYLLDNLCDETAIDTDNRSLTWYAIRHSTGTNMVNEAGIEAAAEQLRHKSPATTRKYDNAPLNERRDALNDIG